MNRKISRREFLQLSVLVTAGSALTACSTAAPTADTSDQAPEAAEPEGSEPGDAPPETGDATAFSIFIWEEGEGGYQADKYMEQNPNVEIEIILGAGEAAKLDSLIAAGTPPDSWVTGDDAFAHWYTANAVLDMQPMVSADTEFKLDDFFPAILQATQGPAGEFYGVGPDFGAQLLWYNKSMFDAAGIGVPDSSWTWENMKEAAAALTQGEGATKVYGTLPFDVFFKQSPPIWQNGGEVFSADGKTCVINSVESVEAIDYEYGYIQDGLAAAPGALQGMGMDSGQLFTANRVALFPGGHWEKWQFQDTEDFEWGVANLPQNKSFATYLHQAFWVASSATQVPEAVWEWIKFVSSPEMSTYQSIEFGGLSTRKAVAEQLVTAPPEGVHPGLPKVWQALLDSALEGKNFAHVLPFGEIIDSVWTPAFEKLWSAELTPQETADEIKAGADAILAKS
jgi:multiple sugar transport system substrate-binding protein